MELRGRNSIPFYLLISLATATLAQPFGTLYRVGQLERLKQEVEMVAERTSGDCDHFNDGHNEECKYYGSCCNDPMRLREMLQRGIFHCETLNTTRESKSKCPV